MRIKEEIKRLGYFWLPSEPDEKLPGTLSISDGGFIELEVVHRVSGRNAAFGGNIERIVGEIERDGLVTLDDCYYKPRIIRAIGGPSKSFFHVGKAFIKIKYDEGEIPLFNTLTFSVEGIDEWVGITGIHVDSQSQEHTATISYQSPANVSLDLDNGMRLVITFSWTLPGFPIIKEAKISQKINFTLISQDMRALDEFISVAQKITGFLCFAIDEIVCLDSISATSDDLRQDIGEGEIRAIPINIYYPSGPYSKEEPRIYQNYLLFGFEQIQNDAEEKIINWIEIYEQIEPALDLYFLAKMGAQPTSKAKFLALAQGLEACHRRINGSRRDFGKRLEDITQPFEDIIRNQTTREELISTIVNTRNYWTHYDRRLESKAAKDEDLPLLCLQMESLFQLYLLRLIGFRREQIDAILANSIFTQAETQITLNSNKSGRFAI